MKSRNSRPEFRKPKGTFAPKDEKDECVDDGMEEDECESEESVEEDAEDGEDLSEHDDDEDDGEDDDSGDDGDEDAEASRADEEDEDADTGVGRGSRGGLIRRTWRWKWRGGRLTLKSRIPASLYDRFRSGARVLNPARWAEVYVAGGICHAVEQIARTIVEGEDLTSRETVDMVVKFVQQIVTYEPDIGEYPRYPIETLVDGAGDCEDFVILGAALLRALGYQVCLIVFEEHVALGVAGEEGLPGYYWEDKGSRYYHYELTGRGWELGEIPDPRRYSKARLYPVP